MQNEKPRIGILLPTRSLVMGGQRPTNMALTLSMAETAEQAGLLDSVWLGDSLTAKPRPEPVTALAALAARTRRVRLGTAVLLAALRHPVLLAHAVATVDLVAEGRTVLAVGVGGAFNDDQRQEWRNAGVDPTRLASRLEEMIQVIKPLTRGEEVTFKGKHFDLDSVRLEPKSPQPDGIPVLVACHWNAGREAQFRRAATLGDGYISISDTPDEYALLADKLGGYAEEAGRDFHKMEAAFYMTVNLDRDERKAAEEADRYLQLYYGMNIWGDRWGPYGEPERVAERMRRCLEAGAGTLIVRFASADEERQLDLFLSEVVPAL